MAMDRRFKSDSIRREMASRCFLRWYDAVITEKGNGGEGTNEEEVEKNMLQDTFVVSFDDPVYISHFSMNPRTAICLSMESIVISCWYQAML